jgi:hypothetical protein
VVKVRTLEGDAIFETGLQVLYRVLRLVDVLKEGLAADEALRLLDDGVAHLPHQHDQPRRRVVEPGGAWRPSAEIISFVGSSL